MRKEDPPIVSRIAKANTQSGSIRTTIPKEVAELLDLDIRDILVWEINQKAKSALIKRMKQ